MFFFDGFELPVLSEAEWPQIQCLSPEGEFWERSSAYQVLFAVKRALEWLKFFSEREMGFGQ
jgi:hypothetical protein